MMPAFTAVVDTSILSKLNSVELAKLFWSALRGSVVVMIAHVVVAVVQW